MADRVSTPLALSRTLSESSFTGMGIPDLWKLGREKLRLTEGGRKVSALYLFILIVSIAGLVVPWTLFSLAATLHAPNRSKRAVPLEHDPTRSLS